MRWLFSFSLSLHFFSISETPGLKSIYDARDNHAGHYVTETHQEKRIIQPLNHADSRDDARVMSPMARSGTRIVAFYRRFC